MAFGLYPAEQRNAGRQSIAGYAVWKPSSRSFNSIAGMDAVYALKRSFLTICLSTWICTPPPPPVFAICQAFALLSISTNALQWCRIAWSIPYAPASNPTRRRVLHRTDWLFEPGQRVRVTKGPFEGLDAIFNQGLDGTGRVQVLLNVLGAVDAHPRPR